MSRVAALERVPRRSLGVFPTPLHRADALAEWLGLRRELWLKRDDLTGPGLGGNKVRKLEYLLGDALATGVDCVVTVGAGQSNHARLTAILGRVVGLEVHLVLGDGEPVTWEGNQLLDRLAGATTHFVDSEDWSEWGRRLDEVAEELRASGRRPYVLPLGGSTEIGALGYAGGYLELLSQLDAHGISADWVVHASSTGGTQAGLLAGRVVAGRGPRVFGVDVAKGGIDLEEAIVRLAAAALARIGFDADVSEADLFFSDFTGEAYGAVTEPAARALVGAMRVSGTVLDPVYSAKALAALPDLDLPGDAPVVFLHTGGQPALFTQANALEVMKRGGDA